MVDSLRGEMGEMVDSLRGEIYRDGRLFKGMKSC